MSVPRWASPLLKYLNGQQRVMQQVLQGNLGVGNLEWDEKSAVFSHGVPVLLSTTKVKNPKGVIVFSADGQILSASPSVQPSPIPGQIKVTLYFCDSTAKNVKVGLAIVPNGEATGRVAKAPATSGIAAVARSFPPDANDILVYHLDETASPWVNSGTASGADLAIASGSVLDSVPGLFAQSSGALGRGLHFRNTAADRAIGGAAIEPAFPITISAWWNPEATSTVNDLFMKYFRPDGTWTTPFVSVNLDVNSGVFEFKIAVAGAQIVLASSSTRDQIAISGVWHFIVGTYDGANMRLYINGKESVNSPKAQTGAIDYGTHGPWGVEDSTGSTNAKHGTLDECRLANVIRSAAWVAEYWQTAMLLT